MTKATRHYVEKHKRFYLYDDQTAESSWEDLDVMSEVLIDPIYSLTDKCLTAHRLHSDAALPAFCVALFQGDHLQLEIGPSVGPSNDEEASQEAWACMLITNDFPFS